MSATPFTIEDAKAANFSVVEEATKGRQAVHDVVVAMQANRRAGTACTKTRGKVRGSNRKLWRQKGTGRARVGDRRSPIWVGGGVAHGPIPHSYAKSVNKQTKRLAFRKALSERILAGDVHVADAFAVGDGKTKSFVKELAGLHGTPKVLIIAAAFDDKTYLAARNVGTALLMTASEVNVEQLLRYDGIIIARDAFDTLAARTA